MDLGMDDHDWSLVIFPLLTLTIGIWEERSFEPIFEHFFVIPGIYEEWREGWQWNMALKSNTLPLCIRIQDFWRVCQCLSARRPAGSVFPPFSSELANTDQCATWWEGVQCQCVPSGLAKIWSIGWPVANLAPTLRASLPSSSPHYFGSIGIYL